MIVSEIDEDVVRDLGARIDLATRLRAIAAADLVIEAVPGSADVKGPVLDEVGGIVSGRARIASSSRGSRRAVRLRRLFGAATAQPVLDPPFAPGDVANASVAVARGVEPLAQ